MLFIESQRNRIKRGFLMEPYFWRKSYDPGLKDLNPKEWEITYNDAFKPTFEKYPNAFALEYLGVEMTFREIDNAANQFAQMLIQNGFGKDHIIGISLPNCPQFIIAVLGGFRAGCAISGVSPLLSLDELEFQLQDLSSGGKKVAFLTLDAVFEARLVKIADRLEKVSLIITTNIVDYLSKLKQFLAKKLKKVPMGKVTPLSNKVLVYFKDILKMDTAAPPYASISPDDIAFIMYTGGTTGDPKGAMITHRSGVADLLISQQWLGWTQMRGQHKALSGFPFFHIGGMFFCLNAIYLGWAQILVPNPRDTDFICNKIAKYRPNYLVNVPSLCIMLMNNPRFRTLDHSQFRNLITAAAPFPKEKQEEFQQMTGGEVIECYGMTECSPLSAMNPSLGKKKLGTVGLPLLNTHIKLIDHATKELVDIGHPGEICVKGPQVMKGYYNNPKETAIAIDSEGYMHTGDVGIFDEEGFLRIVDRTKDMINVSGFKVFSKKVEDALSQHSAVDMIALIGLLNPKSPGSEIVKAYMTVKPGYPNRDKPFRIQEEILAFAKEKLAPYEVPKILDIREELPLTAVGKVNKVLLRKENHSFSNQESNS
jgi:long-chain acyl-CoA synthetase